MLLDKEELMQEYGRLNLSTGVERLSCTGICTKIQRGKQCFDNWNTIDCLERQRVTPPIQRCMLLLQIRELLEV